MYPHLNGAPVYKHNGIVTFELFSGEEMGLCNSKSSSKPNLQASKVEEPVKKSPTNSATPVNEGNENHRQPEEEVNVGKRSPFFPFYSPSPAHYLFSNKSPANPKETAIPEENESDIVVELDQSLGF
ncbi:hypothetical protein HHK36_016089 [Tetracentron sinense]|uniref:Uncharacterized protein n=1 Tax=Tetracentron sinense TaxID=13715 RepID=A0A834YZI8_TETSI|nr:hypothetical protein HHK36_016089 [Tetracentron sinense]